MLILSIVFLPFLCGLCAYLIGRKNESLRDNFVIAAALIELLLCLLLLTSMPSLRLEGFLVTGMSFMTDGFRAAYAIVTAIMWAGTTLFAKEYFKHEREGLSRYWLFVMITLGATEGVMLSGDLMTTFLFFEILSLTSFTWVIHEETDGAIRAGYTYLFIAVIGGLILLMGLLLLYHAAGTLDFRELPAAVSAASDQGMILAGGICILFGFGAKAGMFPLHIWLPKAHPVAPSPASALLSGILTKVGVYGILMTTLQVLIGNYYYGLLVLILGVITMALGAVLALFSVNLKRTLACSSMSQIGFILTGVSMTVLLTAEGSHEAFLALSGAMLHMVNHSLIKLTLFMCAGVVVMNLEKLILDDIRGWGRNKTLLKISFGLGALGISGVPLFNGYISKTMLHEGIVEGIHEIHHLAPILHAAEWIFLISGGCTFAYMLKLFFCIFVEKNKDPEVQARYDADASCMNTASTIAVFGSSLFMVLLGQPAVMTRLAAFMTGDEEIMEFAAFSWTNLKGGLISLAIGGLLYLIFVKKVLFRRGSYVDLWPAWLDLEDTVYRPLLLQVLAPAGGFIARCLADCMDALVMLLRATVAREKPVIRSRKKSTGYLAAIIEENSLAGEQIFTGFTYALLMTCVGILVILGYLIWYFM
ncbi:MAG: complex I subunit 5 family protein [Lachnospiraceae bacterium]